MLPLPRLEHDRAVVLLARPVLREQAREVRAVDEEDRLGAVMDERAPDGVLREASAQQRLRLVHDVRVLRVQEETEPLRSGQLR